MLVTTAADLSWSDWPLWKGMFLPFVDAALNHLLQDLGQTHNQVAGAPLRWHPREWDAAQPIILIHPDGRRTPLGTPELEKGRPVVTTNDTARAGIYRLGFASGTPGSGGGRGKTLEGIPFAVVPDPRETEDLTSLTDEQLDQRLDFKTIHFTAGSQANVPLVAERLSREWTLWLLGAAILIGLFESAFAWFCNRPR
jgi:hypothetical protein